MQLDRLRERGADDAEQMARRIAQAEAEEALADRFDAIVVNDDADAAASEVAAILAGRRAARDSGPEPAPDTSIDLGQLAEITLPPGSTHHMAERRASLMEPRIESLLDRENSKFTLVTLAAKRAREINDYYNQLGEGLGKIVPPQVTSVSRKPLSIALEEIEVGKIIKAEVVEVEVVEVETPKSTSRTTPRLTTPASSHVSVELGALRGRRVVLGVAGGIAAYKAVEVCRRLVDAGAWVSPVLTEDATRFIGALTFSALGLRAGADLAVRGSETRSRTPCLGQSADLIIVAPATARLLGKYAAGISDDLLTATLARDPGSGARRARDAHRDVGARRGPGEPRARCGAVACTWSTRSRAGSPAATSAPGRLADPARIVAAAAERAQPGP